MNCEQNDMIFALLLTLIFFCAKSSIWGFDYYRCKREYADWRDDLWHRRTLPTRLLLPHRDGGPGTLSQWNLQVCVNSLTPERFDQNFRQVISIFKLISVTDGWGISCKIALRWMSLDLTDDKSTLVQVMAWCRQATSHYLSQCWPRSMSPNGITRPEWVDRLYVV